MLRRVIEQVYLTYMGGTPLVTLSRSRIDGDPEIIAAMFTAVQNFMDDSFHSIGVGEVRSMERGRRHHIAFGRGRHALLYVVYRGRESNRLERQVQHVVGEIEGRYARELDGWNGDMERVAAMRGFLEKWFGMREAPDPGPAGRQANTPPVPPPSGSRPDAPKS
ncbi:MAG: hypothetical protein E6K10_06585 [Methanobacteriota archaeon]|nr:MAG: hypothetical protein E6K10_06585 [Euryarchaeota archaeon]